jgi:hypothetical protein
VVQFIFKGRLTGDIYPRFLQDELPPLLEDVPLAIRLRMYFQHDRARPHFSRTVKTHLNYSFPGRWIGRGGAQICPPTSLNLNHLDFYLWRRMEELGVPEKSRTRDALLRRILDAASHVKNDCNELMRLTRAIHRQAEICIEAEGGHFEQLMSTL